MSNPKPRGYWYKLAGLVGAGAIAGVIGASALSAGAETSSTSTTSALAPTSTSTSSSSTSVPGMPPGADHGGGPRGNHGGPGGDEHSLSSTITAKLKTAALQHVKGGTVNRVESDSGDASYEVHMTNASGKQVTVKFDKNLKFVAVEDGMGK